MQGTQDAATGASATPRDGRLLTFDAVSLTYRGQAGDIHAVEDFSLEVARGESVTVIGPSGCGKSTVLLLAAGLLAPGAGRVEVEGSELVSPRLNTALILQDFGLLPWKTVFDNAELGLSIRKLDKLERRKRVDEALRQVELSDFAKAYPAELSGGMRQRLALARVLALDVDLLLMDEPLSSLDALLREGMQDVLLRLWRSRGYAQLMVTHSIEEAVCLGQRVICMGPRPGRVVAEIPNPEAGSPDYRYTPLFHERCRSVRRLMHELTLSVPAPVQAPTLATGPAPSLTEGSVEKALPLRAQEAELEPMVEEASEPLVVPEPEPEPEPEPLVVPKPEPLVVPEPEPEPLVVPEPVFVPEPEPEPEPLVVPEPEPLVVPEPVFVPEPEPEPELLVVLEPEPEPISVPVVVSEPEPEPSSVPDGLAGAALVDQGDAGFVAVWESEPDPEPEAEVESGHVPDLSSVPKAAPEPVAMHEEADSVVIWEFEPDPEPEPEPEPATDLRQEFEWELEEEPVAESTLPSLESGQTTEVPHAAVSGLIPEPSPDFWATLDPVAETMAPGFGPLSAPTPTPEPTPEPTPAPTLAPTPTQTPASVPTSVPASCPEPLPDVPAVPLSEPFAPPPAHEKSPQAAPVFIYQSGSRPGSRGRHPGTQDHPAHSPVGHEGHIDSQGGENNATKL
ncbi:MAG: ATP-binding cassette domain-containing protein [Coriobacteriales bacterium]|jgi:NitT/TauT family transport system ATP-binding protein|nr:ATP-binding cassette domain-containing protein [Coriobacteriales bacterium]